ncbi:MAG: type II toxin-antitoxin system RelE/ParE family toxin [Methylovulum sp.]|nr:type II toxin-antitoxin system RelE/ParE family toxin [Methylovulum sp.]
MYLVKLMPRAIKELKDIPKARAKRIVEKISGLEHGLGTDVKKLANFTPEYRLRVGDYRVLFEIESQQIIIYRVKHRKNAYAKR